MQDPALAQRIGRNPVRLARPKAPRAYQTESTQALSEEELAALLQVIKRRADAGDLVGELTGSVVKTQDALGHRNAAMTRVHVQRVAVKRDKHSRKIAERLGVGRA